MLECTCTYMTIYLRSTFLPLAPHISPAHTSHLTSLPLTPHTSLPHTAHLSPSHLTPLPLTPHISTLTTSPLPPTDLTSAFGLLVHWPQDPQEKLLVFRMESGGPSKKETVHQLAQLLAEAHFSTNAVRELSARVCMCTIIIVGTFTGEQF